jgi:phage antirepressor YoqD-like protein
MIHQVSNQCLDLVVRNHITLMDDLKSMKIGRDKLFDILRANHLLIQPKALLSL